MRLITIALLLALSFSTVSSAAIREMKGALNIHNSLRGQSVSALPRNIVISKGYIQVSEINNAGIEEVDPEWSKNADTLIRSILSPFLESVIGMNILEFPKLIDSQQDLLDQHINLFELANFEYIDIKKSWHPAWQHKRDNMDVTVGPGLSFLQASGADALLVVLAEQTQSSLLKLSDSAKPGSSFITFGLLDLKTGNVIWTNTMLSSSLNLQSETDIRELIDSAFRIYPRY